MASRLYIYISKITHICSHTCSYHNCRTNLSSRTKVISAGGKRRGEKGEGNKLNIKFINLQKYSPNFILKKSL